MEGSVIAIVPAAGQGTRLGGRKPFVLLLGKPVILWTIEALQASPLIEEIIPVLNESDLEDGARLVEYDHLSKVKRIARGGAERQDSVRHGLMLIEEGCEAVLIHDGARPLLTPTFVEAVLQALPGFDGAVAAVPPKDTIKEAGPDGLVRGTLRRQDLWAVQTPQAFPYRKLMEAYEAAGKDGFYSTDDSALVERIGGRVKVVPGSYENIKITTPEDIGIAEAILTRRRAG